MAVTSMARKRCVAFPNTGGALPRRHCEKAYPVQVVSIYLDAASQAGGTSRMRRSLSARVSALRSVGFPAGKGPQSSTFNCHHE